MIMSSIFSGVSNSEIFELARCFSPQFKSHTAEVTASRLDDGWEANKSLDSSIVNEWFNVSMKMILEKVDIASAKNPLESYGIVENYLDEYGNMAQRIAVNGMKPVNPKFHGLQDGDSVDHYVVRKPSIKERFFTQNFDFQNFFTLQNFQIKQILSNRFGMDQITAGCMQQLENSYTKQRYLNELEALSAGINSTDFPLLDTQKINLSSWTDNAVTDAELLSLIDTANDVIDNMTLSPSTAAYNAGKFDSAINKENMVMLMRPDIVNRIKTRLEVGAFNKEDLALPIPVDKVLNFGGLKPQVEVSGNMTDVYPVYNTLGEQIGWSTTEDDTEVEYENGVEEYLDTNSDVLAVIIQKGAIFTTQQNGVEMIPTPVNARGVYMNYFFNVINAGVHFDYNYNIVVITKPISNSSEISSSILPIGG